MLRLFLAAFVTACSSGAPPPAVAPPGITLELTSATVHEMATAFATRTGEPLVVTPDAERYASCVHLTLLVPTPRPVPEVVALLEAPLRAEGFGLTRASTGWTLTHEGGVPTGCEHSEPALREPPIAPVLTGTPPPPTGPVIETRAEIPRRDMEAWLADQDGMMRSARVIPHEEGGMVVGLRLYGIRRTSMLSRLGFENGDTVYSVNGQSVADPEHLLEAYSELREADEYRVDLSRRGERHMHVIRVAG